MNQYLSINEFDFEFQFFINIHLERDNTENAE